MQKRDINLGERLFAHRRSHVKLLTKVATTILCKNADHPALLSDEMLDPCRLWLPRARVFRLSLQFQFSDDVDLTAINPQGLESIVTDLVENAELWAQLGYEASPVECQLPGSRGSESFLQVDFELQSHRDIDSQSWFPAGAVSWDLQSVRLHLHLIGKRRIDTDPRNWTSTRMQDQDLCQQRRFRNGDDVGEAQSSSVAEDESAEYQLPANRNGRSTAAQDQASQQVRLRQRNAQQTLLDKDVFSAFLDAGLRCSMCPKPIRLATGLKCLIGQDSYYLCDLAPATFALNYVRRLQEQALLIPGISRLLETFINAAPSSKPGCDSGRLGPDGNRGERKSQQGLQTHLWDLLRNGVRNQDSARRLSPMKSSEGVRLPNSMLGLPHAFSPSWHIGSRDEAFLQSDDFGSCRATSEDDLFGLRLDLDCPAIVSCNTVPVLMAKALNDGERRPSDRCRDESGGPIMAEIYGCPFEGQAGPGSPQHESRKYSKSVSPMSDVSMLLPCERPIKDGRIVGHPQAIGGSSWLTQNVIRMHPLRQQQHQHDELGQQASARKRHSLYEGPNLEWWSDTSDASDLPLEDSYEQYTNLHLDNPCISSFCASETERVHDHLELQSDSEDDQLIVSTSSMSRPQSRESSSCSLAEVIGNDHLLWHIWKRRASVAPRGEEDISDMKTLFATDPDMKLFSSRWDLDPSDISSGSNEDPMLQETVYNRSPRDKANSPMTPNSERRSYFAITRSPSSSGHVGRSTADPKRRSSLIKRFTWGGRQSSPQAAALEAPKLEQRTIEVKRRKTLDDYEMMDKEASNDDSSDMLF